MLGESAVLSSDFNFADFKLFIHPPSLYLSVSSTFNTSARLKAVYSVIFSVYVACVYLIHLCVACLFKVEQLEQ